MQDKGTPTPPAEGARGPDTVGKGEVVQKRDVHGWRKKYAIKEKKEKD